MPPRTAALVGRRSPLGSLWRVGAAHAAVVALVQRDGSNSDDRPAGKRNARELTPAASSTTPAPAAAATLLRVVTIPASVTVSCEAPAASAWRARRPV
jgi:hypothetical protein